MPTTAKAARQAAVARLIVATSAPGSRVRVSAEKTRQGAPTLVTRRVTKS